MTASSIRENSLTVTNLDKIEIGRSFRQSLANLNFSTKKPVLGPPHMNSANQKITQIPVCFRNLYPVGS